MRVAGAAPGRAALAGRPRTAWVMLLALCTTFGLSQAYRSVAAILASPLQAEFALSAQQLGLFSASFHFAFAAMQFFMGMGIDLYGVRRTLLVVFPLAIAGSVASAWADGLAWLVAGQIAIGVGCAPAFLVCTVFIAQRFAAHRFASVSGLAMGIGGLGMLATGTPLAWLVQETSWRMGFLVLAGAAAVAWLAVALLVHEQAPQGGPRESVRQAVRNFAALCAMPRTLGIVVLGALTYAAFLSLRGLWLGPLLIERQGYSLVQSGNVALAVSVLALVGPPLFGRFDPGNASRRRWIVDFTLAMAALFAVIAFARAPAIVTGMAIFSGFLSGFIVLQYADVRASYPAALTGRAMAVFTMAMFLGVALMQWFTGAVASAAAGYGVDAFTAVFCAIALLLTLGALAFAVLPRGRADQA